MSAIDQIKEFTVPQDLADKIEQFVCNTEVLQYRRINETINQKTKDLFSNSINLDSNHIDGILIRDSYFFAKLIALSKSPKFDPENYFVDEESFPHLKDLQDYIALNVIKDPMIVQLFRINCFTQMFNDDSIPTPHLDVNSRYFENPGFVSILYYINDSTGDTHFFDTNTKKLIKKVSPKKGTGVMFNPTILHAGKFPNNHVPRFVAYILCSLQ